MIEYDGPLYILDIANHAVRRDRHVLLRGGRCDRRQPNSTGKQINRNRKLVTFVGMAARLLDFEGPMRTRWLGVSKLIGRIQ